MKLINKMSDWPIDVKIRKIVNEKTSCAKNDRFLSTKNMKGECSYFNIIIE